MSDDTPMSGQNPLGLHGRRRLRGPAGGLGTIAALLLVALAFMQLLGSRGGHTAAAASKHSPATPTHSPATTPAITLTPTAAPVPAFDGGLRVAWHELTYPQVWCQLLTTGIPACGNGNTYAPATLGFTAADPNTLYACTASPNGASNTSERVEKCQSAPLGS